MFSTPEIHTLLRFEVDACNRYNVVLSHNHVITINGLNCITLGHGVTGHPVLSHPFFGTQAVVASLMRLPVAEGGRIHVKHGFVRDASGLVCDLAYAPQ